MLQRTDWIRALQKIPAPKLIETTEHLSKNWSIRFKTVPQCGLGMIQLQDSAFEEPFYLGEFPISSAYLEIKTETGTIAEGAAQIMDDHRELAEAMAICDAILSTQIEGYAEIVTLLEEGQQKVEEETQERKRILAKTQVDFSLLDDVGEDDD